MPVLPGAEPFSAAGGRVGALILHGFTGSPQSMRPWAEHLAAAGLAVELPRLPGHGTRWQDLQQTRWTDWYGEAERALDTLRARCDSVVVMGLSMGGTLALRLAEQRPADVAGLVLVNPSVTSDNRALALLPVLKHLVPTFPAIGSDIRKPGVTELAYPRTPLKAVSSLTRLWALVRADLGSVTCPVLIYLSSTDHVVEPSSAVMLRAGLRAPVEERVLADSYHVATLDNDAPAIFAGSLDFALASAGSPAAG